MKSRSDFIRAIIVLFALSTPAIAISINKPLENNRAEDSSELSGNQANRIKISDKSLKNLLEEGAISETEFKSLSRSGLSDQTKTNKDVETELIKNNNLQDISYDLKKRNKEIIIDINNISTSDNFEINETNIGWTATLYLLDKNIQAKEKKKFNINNYGVIEISNTTVDDKILQIKFLPIDKDNSVKPSIINENNLVRISVKELKLEKKNDKFLRRRKISRRMNKNRAIAPPLGDIATGSLIVENRAFIKLDGPDVSMTLQNASAKDSLLQLSKLGKFGFVYLNDVDSDNNGLNKRNDSSNISNDSSPKVTLNFNKEDFSRAFNSILLASGLQAKKEGNLIMVGKNVLGKSFGPQLSKVYRLNQASSSSAADYLASLGATINKVNVLTSSSTSKGSSGSSTARTSTLSVTNIDSYSATNGPLKGLIGTTDSRLQSITLIGDEKLIKIAEKYLKQIDLRQRQVALSVKILDVELVDNDEFRNDIALRAGSAFLVNENGTLVSSYGKFLPEFEKVNPLTTTTTTTSTDGVIVEKITKEVESSTWPNPAFKYNDKEIYNYLTARIQANSTKVLASPTLLLSESKERLEGGQQEIAKIGSGSAFIGRPYANESFVTVGTRVITDLEAIPGKDGAPTKCTATFSISGLEFGAKVHKIDDNGYVTFTLSPKLTSVSETATITDCGTVNILSVRKLDTGTLRVRDSQTLILTGVISDLDSENLFKVPILGDIPIVGNLFRKSNKTKRKSELIIMVTPTIIDDSDIGLYKSGYVPKTSHSKEMLRENNN